MDQSNFCGQDPDSHESSFPDAQGNPYVQDHQSGQGQFTQSPFSDPIFYERMLRLFAPGENWQSTGQQQLWEEGDEEDIENNDELISAPGSQLMSTSAASTHHFSEAQPSKHAQEASFYTEWIPTEADGRNNAWSTSEDEILLEIWPRKGTRLAKTTEFNKRVGASRSVHSVVGRLKRLSRGGPECEEGKGPYTQDEQDTLRDICNDPSVKPEERAVLYNSIEKRRTESALRWKYATMVKAGLAPSNAQLEFSHEFQQNWLNAQLSLDERTNRINSYFGKEHTTSELAARYHNLIKEDAQKWSMMQDDTGDGPDSDGTWEAREVCHLVDMWQTLLSEQSFYNKALDMMGQAGNDRSLSSMENKWRQVTGLGQFEHSDLREEQARLDAESKFRSNDRGWTRLEDNMLRRVCLSRENEEKDWNGRYKDWNDLMGKSNNRDPGQIALRWDDLKITFDPFSK